MLKLSSTVTYYIHVYAITYNHVFNDDHKEIINYHNMYMIRRLLLQTWCNNCHERHSFKALLLCMMMTLIEMTHINLQFQQQFLSLSFNCLYKRQFKLNGA